MLPFFTGETKRLSKPIAWKSLYDMCIHVPFKFILQAQGRGEMNLPVEIASWLNGPQKACGMHPYHIPINHNEMVCEDCNKENIKSNDGK